MQDSPWIKLCPVALDLEGFPGILAVPGRAAVLGVIRPSSITQHSQGLIYCALKTHWSSAAMANHLAVAPLLLLLSLLPWQVAAEDPVVRVSQGRLRGRTVNFQEAIFTGVSGAGVFYSWQRAGLVGARCLRPRSESLAAQHKQ